MAASRRRGRPAGTQHRRPRTPEAASGPAAADAAPPSPLLDDQEWFSTSEVGRLFRVCKMTVLRMIEAGELSAVRVRPVSPYRIPRSEVERVLILAHAQLRPSPDHPVTDS